MFPYRRLPCHITGLYVFTVTNFVILCHITLVQGDIAVINLKNNNTVISDIPDMPAYFGGHIDNYGIKGQVVYANPANACDFIDPPPRNASRPYPELGWFVLIMRSGCNFSKKVYNAEYAGFNAAIIHNVGSNQLEPMGPDKDTVITIPSVFIGESDGLMIKNLYTYDRGFYLSINNEIPDIFWSIDLDKYLLPFACMLAVCFIATMTTMVVKCIRDRRQRQRHRLPTRLLSKLPIKKFKKGDHYDICAICLDDYVEGEKLRVLPCSHAYHMKCIDPWLTENKRTCPVCKRKVLPSGNRNDGINHMASDSDDDSDEGGEAAGSMASPTESTPLLDSAGNSAPNYNRRMLGLTRGAVNPALVPDNDLLGLSTGVEEVDRPAAESYQNRAVAATPPSETSSLTSSGGWYQSFANSTIGSPSVSSSALRHGGGGGSSDSLLTVPAVIVARSDLLSSGEHSVNGDFNDYAPIAGDVAKGPVEIAVDVASRTDASSATASSLPSTSSNQFQSSSSRSPRRFRGSKSSKKKRSQSSDMVV